MTEPVPRRGEVWFAEIPGDKRRPVVVLTRDPLGRLLRSVICAPVTSRIRGLSTEVHLDEAAGLAHDAVVNLDNTFLLARTGLRRRLGTVSSGQMQQICAALTTAIGCSPPRCP